MKAASKLVLHPVENDFHSLAIHLGSRLNGFPVVDDLDVWRRTAALVTS